MLDFNRNAQIDFLGWINAGAVTLKTITSDDLQRIKELTIEYSDLPMDFADGCLVFLGEKFNINTIATIDRDFDVYRLKGKGSFTTFIKWKYITNKVRLCEQREPQSEPFVGQALQMAQ